MSPYSTSRLLGAGLFLALCITHVIFAAEKHTLLVVLTHGDDDVTIAPLLAKSAAQGHTVYYAMFTGLQDLSGEESSPARQEVLCASRVLGVLSDKPVLSSIVETCSPG
jgi:hypothetical protein